MNDSDVKIICEEVPPGTVAQLTPGRQQKVVHLVRHGQATHNLYAQTRIKEGEACPCMSALPGCPYREPVNEDAKLTQRGRLQATATGSKLLHTKPIPQIVLVSPLFRTLQTATIGFSTIPHVQAPIIAEEQIRERMGMHLCDKRSDKNKLMSYFSKVEFANIAPGPDHFFDDIRESEEETAARGKKFFLSLKNRPEESFCLVSHSSFLFNTLTKACETPNPQAARRFVTGEVRCVLLTFEQQ